MIRSNPFDMEDKNRCFHFFKTGFTLIDLLLVIAILSLTGLITLPFLTSAISSEKVETASRELLAGMIHAENLALFYGRPFGIGIDEEDNRFEVFDERFRNDSTTHPHERPSVDSHGIVISPHNHAPYRFDLDDHAMTRGVRLRNMDKNSENILLFYPDGHISHLSTTFILEMKGFSRKLSVNGVSGKIHVQ